MGVLIATRQAGLELDKLTSKRKYNLKEPGAAAPDASPAGSGDLPEASEGEPAADTSATGVEAD